MDAPLVRSLIERALQPGTTCDLAEAAELEGELRGCIARLLPEAEAAVDALWYGSLDWFLRSGRLKVVRELQENGPEAQLLPPHVYVRHLARDCRVLLEYLGLEKGEQR